MKLFDTAILVSATVVLLAGGDALADENLAKKNGCASCHVAGKKLVGPSWQDIAAKYKADAKAADTLAAKVKAGGKGVWGAVPMPPQAKVADADLKAILGWVLGH